MQWDEVACARINVSLSSFISRSHSIGSLRQQMILCACSQVFTEYAVWSASRSHFSKQFHVALAMDTSMSVPFFVHVVDSSSSLFRRDRRNKTFCHLLMRFGLGRALISNHTDRQPCRTVEVCANHFARNFREFCLEHHTIESFCVVSLCNA